MITLRVRARVGVRVRVSSTAACRHAGRRQRLVRARARVYG